ncbi:unnamed protein product [Toxocara canis]|uniref:Uncharacterized protein n=1 Tax=Toxocara canis TaxID=6265 RepID=A0A183U0Y4_TOXCA|nr:unnamed protein product [Toxocara canis]
MRPLLTTSSRRRLPSQICGASTIDCNWASRNGAGDKYRAEGKEQQGGRGVIVCGKRRSFHVTTRVYFHRERPTESLSRFDVSVQQE